MQNRIEVYFEAIALEEQRVRGAPDDYLRSAVHFAFRYADGRVDTGCVATVLQRLLSPGDDVIEVSIPGAYQCPAYRECLEQAIADYYRERVGVDGTVIRIGPKGASPLIRGVSLESRASAVIEIGENEEPPRPA